MTYRLLAPRPHPLSALDLGATGDTVVIITLDALRTVDNRLDVQRAL
ncbi:hypothetical protein [Mycobacterium dioxanotrophicus]|nr:hypothetical protein [Mycobacterium dioxanotrophicus]